MIVKKENQATSFAAPLEHFVVSTDRMGVHRIVVEDGERRPYCTQLWPAEQAVSFRVRGSAGWHCIRLLDEADREIERYVFRLVAQTEMRCDRGCYAELFAALTRMIQLDADCRPWEIGGRLYRILISWSRDHVYTLKAARYYLEDVKSGLDFWLDRQTESGMFWDCLHHNTEDPAPTWFGEALGEGWFCYEDGRKYIIRRVPVLADTEYVFAEGVWMAWKASGDDAWMASQLPRLEKALQYLTSDPLRWNPKHGLVRRSFTADEWDFANPHYCAGDHRCIHPGDPGFFFHGNNSGLYAMYRRMAEMYAHLGRTERAAELRTLAEALRDRANRALFFENTYAHMIPETLPWEEVFEKSGDELERMSLSLGYTINRGLPDHEMAVRILREYQRRRYAKAHESFAEWWTMDPPYTSEQWPSKNQHRESSPWGEYMNGGICPIVAGEIARAAFVHGCEDYGVDILRRVWDLIQRDGGHLHQVYRRLPAEATLPQVAFTPIDLRPIANRGLRSGAHPEVEAWTGEGDNDMRNLPTGRRRFGEIEFEIIDPAQNGGRAVLRLSNDGRNGPVQVWIPVPALRAASLYFLHATARSAPPQAEVACYEILYADGSTHRHHIRQGLEIGHWWGISDAQMNREVIRRAWWGENPQWKTVGLYMHGWDNPHPEKQIVGLHLQAVPELGGQGGVMLAAISASSEKTAFGLRIRSYGLPDCWAQAAVHYALADGLAGTEDLSSQFTHASIAPRWAATEAERVRVVLHYPASDGYCAYEWEIERACRTIRLETCGSFRRLLVHLLLPENSPAKRVCLGTREIPFNSSKIESSCYVDFVLEDVPMESVLIEY